MTEIKALQKAALCELMMGGKCGLGWISGPKKEKAFCVVMVDNNTNNVQPSTSILHYLWSQQKSPNFFS